MQYVIYHMCVCSQDDVPELAETFLVNITKVELLGGDTGAAQPSVRRPGLEIAEVTIQENDDPRGVLTFNVSKVDLQSIVLSCYICVLILMAFYTFTIL